MAKEDLNTATTKVKAVVTALNTKPINLGLLFTNLVDGTDKIVDYLKWVDSKMPIEPVDLGLPSGTKWADRNVGAEAPEEYGEYFAWGATVGTTKGQSANYAWPSSYNSTLGYSSNETAPTKLPAAKDAATVNMGTPWRIPTKENIDELKANTTITWTRQNGVNGQLVTSKINGKTLFFPASGYRDGSSVKNVGYYGYYWSSSVDTSWSYYACHLEIGSGGFFVDNNPRYYGFSVRGVL